jgi:hypothetical protein
MTDGWCTPDAVKAAPKAVPQTTLATNAMVVCMMVWDGRVTTGWGEPREGNVVVGPLEGDRGGDDGILSRSLGFPN